MPVNLKVTLGTVNYLDWLHVTASKVSDPTVVVWETWIDVPVTNYNFIIPNLDPENYYIRYYDAATNSALGTLKAELIVNALTSEFVYERRFYTCGGSGTYDPANGDTAITDPYLIGKNVTGIFKEAFRYFEPETEYTFDDTTGTITVINGTTFNTDEKIAIEIKYASGTIAPAGGNGLYTGTLDVTAATHTLLAADRNKRIRCVGSGTTQVITAAALSALAAEDGFYFDNSCGGTAIQVKVLMQGGDRIKYNGFMAASDEFAEFWVSKGEHLLIRKMDSAYYEVITDYKGVKVGSRNAEGYKGMPGTILEDAALYDGDEYPRLWWWLNNILPSTHVITDDLVTGSYTHPAGKEGLFVKHSTLKKFRAPNTQNLSERGLNNFNTYGADAERVYDYPGGVQNDAIKDHQHETTSGTLVSTLFGRGVLNRLIGTYSGVGTGKTDLTGKPVNSSGADNYKSEMRVKNFGVIYTRNI